MWFKQSDLIGKVNPDLSGKFNSDTVVHFERRMQHNNMDFINYYDLIVLDRQVYKGILGLCYLLLFQRTFWFFWYENHWLPLWQISNHVAPLF